jgi:hypothetical protein
VSKTTMACLASFLGVSPFRETQDPMVDARPDFLYRNASAMDKLNELIDKVYKALQEVRCAQDACLEHKYPPKNDGAAAAVEASAPPQSTPTAPPLQQMSPARNVAWPSPMMRAKQPSHCLINGHCRLADPDLGRGKWEGGFLALSMLCNTLCNMLHNI